MRREKIRQLIDKTRELLSQIEAELDREIPAARTGGPPPFGWMGQERTSQERGQKVTKPFVENPREQKIIERILEMREAGKTFESISDTLNAEGHRTRHDGPWSIAGVQRIFANLEKRK